MEKQRTVRKNIFIARLLKIFFALALFTSFLQGENLFAEQRLTYSIIQSLSVRPVNATNFSGTDCAFELKIPYVKSDSVRAQIPELPSGVNFVSLRRSEYSDGETGTKIELWLNFTEAKRYNIRFLIVYINNRRYNISFEPVEIFENPRNILPQLVVSFENGTEILQSRYANQKQKAAFSSYLGTPLTFTVSLKYAVQIVSYSWQVPKNALFRELEQYEITKGTLRTSEFSEEKIPVAKYEWEPLYAGNLYLPDFKIVATSYNGRRVELSLPDSFIEVIDKGVSNAQKDDFSTYFAYAFNSSKKNNEEKKASKLSKGTCNTIAEMRAKERHALPFGAEYKTRVRFEKSVGILESENETQYILLYASVAFCALFLILACIFWIKKKKGSIAFTSAIFIICLVLSIIFFLRLSEEYVIFTGSGIRSVPELTTESFPSIECGTRVLVSQKAGPWLFITHGTTGGWVLEEDVIFIEQKEAE